MLIILCWNVWDSKIEPFCERMLSPRWNRCTVSCASTVWIFQKVLSGKDLSVCMSASICLQMFMLEVGKQGLKWLPGKEEGCKSIPLLHLPHPILYTASLFCPATDTCLLYGGNQRNNPLSLFGKKILAKKETPGALPPVKSPVRRSSSCLESGVPLPREVEHPASHILPLPLSLSFSLPPTFHPVRVHRDSEGASEIYLYPGWRQHHEDFFTLCCDKHVDLIFTRDRNKNKKQTGTCHWEAELSLELCLFFLRICKQYLTATKCQNIPATSLSAGIPSHLLKLFLQRWLSEEGTQKRSHLTCRSYLPE